MTREEEIKQAAEQFCDMKAYPYQDGFIAGAEWADQHPIQSATPKDIQLSPEDYMRMLNEPRKIQVIDKPSPWISVEERLPDRDYHDRSLIVRNKIGIYGACGYEVGRGFFFYGTMHGERYTPDITHWMPIPELKGGEK